MPQPSLFRALLTHTPLKTLSFLTEPLPTKTLSPQEEEVDVEEQLEKLNLTDVDPNICDPVVLTGKEEVE